MDDREVAAVRDPSALAAIYSRYAASLYGYCRWMLREPAASEVVKHTFARAAVEPRDGDELRPWLYTMAREEALRRLRTDGAGFGLAERFDVDVPEDHEADAAELREVIRAALAGLKPHEREIIELSVRHQLDDSELSAVFGVTWSRAHALASHARGHLEQILTEMIMARTGRKDRHGGLRPEVLSGLLPMAPLPGELRDQVLHPGAPAPPRRRSGLVGRGKLRGNPGKATATTAVVMWLAAAGSVTILTVTGSHAVRALAAQARPTASASAPTAEGSATPGHHNQGASRSHRLRPPPRSPAPQAAPLALPSRSPSPSPSPSHSASPSKSASSSPTPSHTPSRSPSPSPSSSRSPNPTGP